jgi:predicted Zn finger-like uncharacterized protein
MPIIVACPNCNGQLRVADDLIGRKVRCPACTTTFDTTEPAPAPRQPEPESVPARPLPNLELPIETEKVDPWKSLNLDLTDDAAKAPAPRPKDTEEIAPPASEEDAKPDPPRRRPRLNDDHDDLRPCPGCRRLVHREARRCISCGERLPDDEDHEDDLRYERRRRKRDWEPHRAGFVLAMGVISVATLFTCWPLAPLAIIPGIMAWVMGSADLRKMRQGTMDPEGHGSTQAGWICGIVGTALNTVVLLGCGTFIGLIWYNEVQKSKRMQPPARFNAPPPPVLPQQK